MTVTAAIKEPLEMTFGDIGDVWLEIGKVSQCHFASKSIMSF
jgi:hypothetical protein